MFWKAASRPELDFSKSFTQLQGLRVAANQPWNIKQDRLGKQGLQLSEGLWGKVNQSLRAWTETHEPKTIKEMASTANFGCSVNRKPRFEVPF